MVFNPDLRGTRKIKRLSNLMKKKYNTSIKSLSRSTNMVKKMVAHIETEHGFSVEDTPGETTVRFRKITTMGNEGNWDKEVEQREITIEFEAYDHKQIDEEESLIFLIDIIVKPTTTTTTNTTTEEDYLAITCTPDPEMQLLSIRSIPASASAEGHLDQSIYDGPDLLDAEADAEDVEGEGEGINSPRRQQQGRVRIHDSFLRYLAAPERKITSKLLGYFKLYAEHKHQQERLRNLKNAALWMEEGVEK